MKYAQFAILLVIVGILGFIALQIYEPPIDAGTQARALLERYEVEAALTRGY